MKVLVFTPDHVFKTDQEKLIGALRDGLKEEGFKGTSLVSARADIDVKNWDEFGEALILDGHYWDAVLVPFRSYAQMEQDLAALQKLARKLPKKNIVVYVHPDGHSSATRIKHALVPAGVMFFHDARDGATLLHDWLRCAAGVQPVKGLEPVIVGPLKIDLAMQRVSVQDVPVKLGLAEFRVLERLAQRHGTRVSTDVLLDAIEDNADIYRIHQLMGGMQRKLGAAAEMIRGDAQGAWWLASADELAREAAAAGRVIDFGWFKVGIDSTGEGTIDGNGVKLDPREVAILEHVHAHPGRFMAPADIAKDMFPDGSVTGIALGIKLGHLQRKLVKADPVYAECFAEKMVKGFRQIMYVPHGTSAEAIAKVNDQRDTKIVRLGWINLEVSPRFNPKRTKMTPMYSRPGARVAETDIILSPQETAAVIYAHKKHGEWLVGRLLNQKDLPKVLKKTQFWTHMNSAFQKLKAGGLQPERFIQMQGITYVRFLRQDGRYPASDATPLPAPRSVADEVRETVNAGDWLTLEIRTNGAGVIRETNRALSPTLTTLFHYAIQHPEEILTAASVSKIFAKHISEKWFYGAMHGLRQVLKAEGFDDVMYAVRNEGATFLPKATVLHNRGNLRGYFSILSQRAKEERMESLRAESALIGPLRPPALSVSH